MVKIRHPRLDVSREVKLSATWLAAGWRLADPPPTMTEVEPEPEAEAEAEAPRSRRPRAGRSTD